MSVAEVTLKAMEELEDKTPAEELEQKPPAEGEVEIPEPEVKKEEPVVEVPVVEADKKETPPEVKKESFEEQQNLRALAREQKRELDRTSVELERMRRQLEKAGLVDEEDKKEAAAEQTKAKEAYDLKMSQLSLILETMKVNPKYEDVEEIVSQDNFDDLVEAMSKVYVQENGGSLREATKIIEGHIWSQPNPYLYSYERIKTYHPKYRKPAEEKKPDPVVEKKKPAEAPPSVAGLPGASSGPGGWTAEQINNLEEEDLPSVPPEVYKKYLLGELK